MKAIGVLVIMAYLADARGFLQGFLFAFGMMVWIGAYDTFFVDWALFAPMIKGRTHDDL